MAWYLDPWYRLIHVIPSTGYQYVHVGDFCLCILVDAYVVVDCGYKFHPFEPDCAVVPGRWGDN